MLFMSIFIILCMIALGVTFFVIFGFIDWLRRLQWDLHQKTGIPSFFKDPSTGQDCHLPRISDEPTKTLSIVMPAYNEQDRLPQTLDETLKYLSLRRDRFSNFTYEVIVVDDGSKDRTSDVVYSYIQKYGLDTLRLITYRQNRGKGFAVKLGLLSARGQRILMADSDGATRIQDVEDLEKVMESQNVDLVLGSRAHLQSKAVAERPAIRIFLMRVFHLLVLMVVGDAIKDTQCGFKLYSRDAVRLIFPNCRLQRWCQDVEIIYIAQKLGLKMKEVKVKWTEMPGSKIRFSSILHMALEIVGVKVAYSLLGLWSLP
eukprot:TRINITY_DN6070_c0_g1_i1.p1 TRINITY_DN6070_c0_g1~~TRINITY_DN6070_c0_g1_i1.p1  ORF type:complete len:356 (+),score=17.33 TRINITY_DN6070_c0_g1_i1:125-1069(+)